MKSTKNPRNEYFDAKNLPIDERKEEDLPKKKKKNPRKYKWRFRGLQRLRFNYFHVRHSKCTRHQDTPAKSRLILERSKKKKRNEIKTGRSTKTQEIKISRPKRSRFQLFPHPNLQTRHMSTHNLTSKNSKFFWNIQATTWI